MAVEVKQVSEQLIKDVKSLIEKGDEEALTRLIDELRPADMADLIEHLDHDERLFIFKILEPEGAGEVLVEIEPPVQGRLLEDLDDKALQEIVQELESDDAADVIGDLPVERAREIIKGLKGEVSEEIEKLLPYPEDTAGGIMALEYVAIKADSTVQDAIEVIREKGDEVENLYYLWVVDGHNHLVGVVSLKDLLLEPRDRKINEIMNPNVISVNVHADQEEVIRLVKKYDLVNIPVVDDHNHLVGRITHDDVIDVIEDEVDEDMGHMAGVLDEEITEESPVKITKSRLPWLIWVVGAEAISAIVISRFASSIEKVVALSFFFPIIMALGGSSGQQPAYVLVRGLATGDLSLMKMSKRLLVEVKVALGNGIVCGALLGIIVGTWMSDFKLGGVVALALMAVMVNGALIGTVMPLVLRKLGADPAIATGPFVSTSNDVFGLLIYLVVVTSYLRFTG